MRKQAVLGTLVSLALVLAVSAVAQAAYDDAISINITAQPAGPPQRSTRPLSWLIRLSAPTGWRGSTG
ncbi:MAG: hypothetical protein NT031_19890 [Planctomycetota bacterium]|nr:hypothetical protein [Planctomycetota bacterium]